MMDENSAGNNPSTDISSLFSGLLSNPEALSKISNIISKIGANENGDNSPPNPDVSTNSQDFSENSDPEVPPTEDSSPTFQNFDISTILSKAPDILSKLSNIKTENSIADKHQIALLLAIRPYLSERRKELIDTFIKMNKFSSIFMSLSKKGD